MKNKATSLVVVVLVPFVGWMVARGGAAEAATLRIEQVTVISPERPQPLRNATVVVRDDRIVSVTSGAAKPAAAGETVIDGTGLYLTPGLIDSHVHLNDVPGMQPKHEQEHPDIAKAARSQFPRSYLLYGYTTLIDLISTPERLARWTGHDPHPDTYFCGATPVMGGYGIDVPPDQVWQQYPYLLVQPGEESKVPKGIDPATRTPKAVIARMKADGARCVKAFAENGFGPRTDIPMIRLETAKELVRAAHAAGLPVLMHANAADMQAFALEAGVDVIAHGMWHWDVPPDRTSTPAPAPLGTVDPAVKKILDEVIARKVGWQPTIQVLHGEVDLIDPDYLANPALTRVNPVSLIEWYRTPAPEGQWFRDLIANFPNDAKANTQSPTELWKAAQGFYAPFLSQETNATAYVVQHHGNVLFGTDTPSSPTYANPPGLNGFMEMHRLVAAGMTPAQVFRAATLSNVEALKLRDVGAVQAGKRANLLLMREDPMQSVDAYASIVKVVLGGRVLDTADLVANPDGKH